MKVLVVDYGMGNLGSVRRALEECGAGVTVSGDPRDALAAERIVLPGVGAFRDGMAHLDAAGWPSALRKALANPQVRLLGICLGMQLLADSGDEGGAAAGLGLIAGTVRRLDPPDPVTRVPHVGWNEIVSARPDPLLRLIPDGTDFYFVHSYVIHPADAASVIATTPYCGTFASVVGSANVYGVQFHPEKSSRPGFQVIRNFLAR
jgi:glutamine amidotransferase